MASGLRIPGYPLGEPLYLSSAEERGRLTPSALRAFVKIAQKWDLTGVQARGLLGGVSSSTFHAWKTTPEGRRLSQDTLIRISLVIGIYKALHIYFEQPWADRWITLQNRGAMFAGRTPLEHMCRRGQPGMVDVRRMLDAWCGGC
jgi:Protein of unknown function (DUF2384)